MIHVLIYCCVADNLCDVTVEADSPQQPTASTPYLERIWRDAKARGRANAPLTAALTGADSDSKTGDQNTPNTAWINEMFSLVTQLEGKVLNRY